MKMKKMLLLVIIMLSVGLSGCGMGNVKDTVFEQKTTTSKSGTTTVTNEKATSSKVDTVEDANIVVDENLASAPSTSNSAQAIDNNSKCNAEYDALISKYGKNYDDCYVEVETSSCDGKEKSNKKKNLVLILDSSGSMSPKIGGKSKMEIAKEAASNFIKNLSEDVNISIVAYGHKGSNSAKDKAVSCAGIEEIYWLDKIKLDLVNSKISPLQATGWTPIADSLQKAKDILAKYPASEYENSVLLISDGEETCGGNPVNKAKEFNNSDIKLTIDVIGFDVSGVAENQLKDISKNGGGVYYSAKNAAEMDEFMNRMSELRCSMKKTEDWAKNIKDVSISNATCVVRIGQENTRVSTALYVNNEISDDCEKYVKEKYDQRYESIKNKIEGLYDEGMDKIDQDK